MADEPAAPAMTPTAPATPTPPAEPSWMDGLDVESRGQIEAKGFKTVQDLAKSWHSAQTLVGVPSDQLIKKPTDPNDPEQLAAYHTALGRPEGADKYTLPESTAGEGGIDLQPKFREWAFAAGLNNRQASQIFEAYQSELDGLVTAQSEERNQHVKLAEQHMRTEWGQEYENNIAAAKRFFHIFGISDPFISTMEAGMITPEDPTGTKAMIRGAAKIGRAISEHKFAGDTDRAENLLGTTPGAAQTQISELLADPKFLEAYQNKMHPGHQAAMDRMSRTQQLAYPALRP